MDHYTFDGGGGAFYSGQDIYSPFQLQVVQNFFLERAGATIFLNHQKSQ